MTFKKGIKNKSRIDIQIKLVPLVFLSITGWLRFYYLESGKRMIEDIDATLR